MKMRRRHVKLLVLILLTATLGVMTAAVSNVSAADQNADKKLNFHWTFGAIKMTEQGAQFETVTRDTVMNSGDQIKFYIKLTSDCFVYLIYASSQGELSILFPQRFKPEDGGTHSDSPYYVPEERQWFELDRHVGSEKFYLLASASRLDVLEKLVNNYESADKSKKSELSDQILAEIRQMRKKSLKFKTYAERPVSIIGNMRGAGSKEIVADTDIGKHAVAVTADSFFSRVFTIDHR